MLLSRNNILIFFILTASFYQLKGQSQLEDLKLIKAKTTENQNTEAHHHHHNSFLLSDHPSAFVRYNPVSLAFGSMMWAYQKVISPQFSSTCLYSPSCSSFSKTLISDFGIITGIVLTADRLSRCNRLALFDFNSWEVDTQTGKIKESTSYYRINE